MIRTTSRNASSGGRRRGVIGYLAAFVATMVSMGALALIGATAASAATLRTWTGAGANALWNNPANWGGTAPNPGDDLVFPAGAARTTNTNNFTAGTAFNSLRFTGESNAYTLTGNQVALGAGGITTGATGTVGPKVGVVLPIRLTANERFSFGTYAPASPASLTYSGAIDLAGHNLDLFGPIAGAGTHRLAGVLTGTGWLTVNTHGTQTEWVALAGTTQTTGTTTVNGLLVVEGDYSTRPVTLNANGFLFGSGKVGRIQALGMGSGVFPVSATYRPTILTVAGDLTMRAGTNFGTTINGVGPGTGYSQAVVTGPISITSATLSMNGDYHPVAGQAFTIIANKGTAAVSGTFAGSPEGSLVTSESNATYRITYKGGASGRDVVLTAVGTGTRRVWTGAGTTNVWTNAANWAGGQAPKAGDDLTFPQGGAQTSNVNNYAAGTPFHSITFGAGYAISGNLVAIGGGGINTSAGDSDRLSLPLKIDADETFTAYTGVGFEGVLDLAGHTLVVGGPKNFTLWGGLSGGGTLLHDGTGPLYLESSSTGPGTIKVANGVVVVDRLTDYSSRSVIVDGPPGTTVALIGQIGSVTAINGEVEQFASITESGSLTLGPGSIYSAQFSSSGDCCQATVKAKVSLGGAVLQPAAVTEVPVGTVVSVVVNQGGAAVSGTFAGLAEGATVTDAFNASWSYRISYVGGASHHDVTLTRLP